MLIIIIPDTAATGTISWVIPMRRPASFQSAITAAADCSGSTGILLWRSHAAQTTRAIAGMLHKGKTSMKPPSVNSRYQPGGGLTISGVFRETTSQDQFLVAYPAQLKGDMHQQK